MSTVLLVIDVQEALRSGEEIAHDIEAVIDRINVVTAKAREKGVPVIFVQHEEPGDAFARDSAGWQLAEGLQAEAGDARVFKTTPDSFNRTDLQARLQALGATRLLICGLQTDFCVDTTVRQALSRDYEVVLLADAHSTLDNDVLSARQIIDHHNWVFGHMVSFRPGIQVMPVAQALALIA